ncbi:hypothetical protein DCAR_0415568 [Daucus carota subsp. sativus]|uniref:Uncharacterized protein n=1 Tax=Daucus carota subsp. sativus TaxID=79200 RepID=A0A162A7R9_DAUCS|nr:hypothetical protein DCAR_0415568 [Daucus carota subsp. sativus]
MVFKIFLHLCRCGKCKEFGHNKRTCPSLHPVEANAEAETADEGDSAELQETAIDYPDQGPPLTQQSQEFEGPLVEEEGDKDESEAASEDSEGKDASDASEDSEGKDASDASEESEDDETPLAIAAKKIRQMRIQKMGLTTTRDSPIMVAAGKLKTLKEIMDSEKKKETSVAEAQAVEMEDARRKTVKQEMQQRIDKGKNPMKVSEIEPRRSYRLFRKIALNKFTNTVDTPVVIDEAGEEDKQPPRVQINSYTGPMKLGKKQPPPVKQYKAIVGQTEVKSAPFLSHGRNVITKGTLAKALGALKKSYLPGSAAKGKDSQQP